MGTTSTPTWQPMTSSAKTLLLVFCHIMPKSVYPLQDVMIFYPKARQIQFTKYFRCDRLATLSIFGRNFSMGIMCTLFNVEKSEACLIGANGI